MDKKRKQQLRREWQEKQRSEARSALPMPYADMKAMFDMLDIQLPSQGCDHTRHLTRSWLESHGKDVEAVFAWLDNTGGFCDCEVLANSEEAFISAVGEL